jgi:ATP-dependent DNA helicase RecG
MNSENETVEYKKSLSEKKEGLISMAAILNKHGKGELWFGIKNDGTALGLEVSEKTLRDLSQSVAAHIEPKVYPTVMEETVEGKTCLKVIFQGGERPYYAYGRAYMRVSDADRQLSAVELERLILEKNQTQRRWDSEKSTLGLDDLYADGIRAFVEKAGLHWRSEEAALENLGLLQNGHLLNAASVFFQMQPPYELRTAVFAGATSATILDRHSFKGGILELIEEAQRYILKNIHIGMKVEGLERVDVPEIHPEAIREAVINAFCHRDYRDPDPVQIAIYQDRVEIRNPGTLIEGMTLEDLRRGTVSRRRNPVIAELLRRIRFVESWGRGIPLILEKAPDTQFSIQAGVFVSTLRRSENVAKTARKTSGKTSGKTSEKTSGKNAAATRKTSDATQKSKVKSKVKNEVKSKVKTPEQLIDFFRKNPNATLQDAADALGKSISSMEKVSAQLRKEGKIRYTGPQKGGHWKVVEKEGE